MRFINHIKNLPVKITPGFIASATEVQKIFITDFDFPFCSMYEKGNPKSLEVQVMIESVAIKDEEKSKTTISTDSVYT